MVASSDPARALDLLLSADGRELADMLASRGRIEPGDEMALGERLRARYPAELVMSALAQHDLRERARAKFSVPERMYFTREGLEQASAEPVARHRAARYAGFERVADLCTGIGGDLLALARGRAALAVDLDHVHLRMAVRNARALGAADLDAACADVGDLRLDQHRRELKEAVLWSPALATTSRRATLLPGGDSLVAAPGPPLRCAAPGAFLLDPNPAVTRAGLVEELGRAVDAWKIDRRVGFLSADRAIATPFARLLEVQESLPWSLKRLRAVLRARGAGAIEIRKRGSAVDVRELRRRLDLSGDHLATVVLTRVGDRPWALVCREP